MDEVTRAHYEKAQRTLEEIRTELSALVRGTAALTRAVNTLEDGLEITKRIDKQEQRIRALEEQRS